MMAKATRRLREELDKPKGKKTTGSTEERRRWCDLYTIDNPRASLEKVRAAMLEVFTEAVGSDYIQASLAEARRIHDEMRTGGPEHDLPVIGPPRFVQAVQIARQAAITSVLDALKQHGYPVQAIVVEKDGGTRIELKPEDATPTQAAG